MARPITPPEVLYEKHADRSGGPDACWPWKGSSRGSSAYGRITFGRSDYVYAHVYAWEQFNGLTVPIGGVVRHVVCDNPPCVNGLHLMLGSQAENLQDMRSKMRQAWGVKHGHHKLSTDDVRVIRNRFDIGQSAYSIAKDYPVAPATVYAIGLRKNWRHLPEYAVAQNGVTFT